MDDQSIESLGSDELVATESDDNITPLKCKCKRGRCDTCSKCPKCECEHDGVPLSTKLSRGRGRPTLTPQQKERKANARKLRARKAQRRVKINRLPEALAVPVHHGVPGDIARDIARLLEMDMGKVKLPSVVQRSEKLDASGYVRTRTFLRNVLVAAIDKVCPGDAERLSSELVGDAAGCIAQEHKRLVDTLQTLMTVAPKGSDCAVVARSALMGSLTKERIRELNICQSNNTIARAKEICRVAMATGQLPESDRSVTQFDVATAAAAVDFVLSEACVKYLSWGSKRCLIGNEARDAREVILPGLIRRCSTLEMWEMYQAEMVARSIRALSLKSFYGIVNALTTGQDSARTAVDYVVSILLNDNYATIVRVIDGVVDDRDEAESWKLRLGLVVNFLKYQFDSHVRKSDGCATHSTSFALAAGQHDDDADDIPCPGCKFPFFVIDELIRLASACDAGAVEVLQNCRHKLRLFMGHRVRVVQQQDAIKRIQDDHKAECSASSPVSPGLLTIDYKMKQQDKYYREDTVKHYGKRGISWHGAMLVYHEWDAVRGAPVEKVFYVDQIVQGESKQDWLSVVALVEAALHEIKRVTPVSKVTLLSDNASYYQGPGVLMFMPTISRNSGVVISRYIHTETQDGKSLLDAHFGRCTGQITQFLNKGNDVATAAQIAGALLDRGGLPNSCVNLICHDRNHLDKLAAAVDKVVKAASKHFLRINDVHFHPSRTASPSAAVGDGAIDMVTEFSFRVYNHSDIGDGFAFAVNLEDGTFVRVDNDVQVLLNEFEGCELGAETMEDEFDSDVEPVDDDEVDASAMRDMSIVDENERRENRVDVGDIMALSNSEIMTKSDVIRVFARERNGIFGRTRKVRIRSGLHGTKTIAAFAVDRASAMSSSSSFARDARSEPTDVFSQAVNYQCGKDEFPRGWARRPKRGEMYGANYVPRYEEHILGMFVAGNDNKSKKKNAAEMVEELRRLFPNKYDLPCENHIQSKIGEFSIATKRGSGPKLSAKGRSHVALGEENAEPEVQRKGRKSVVDDQWFLWVKRVVAADPTVTGKPAWQQLNRDHPPNEANSASYPTQAWVTATVSRLKSKRPGAASKTSSKRQRIDME